MTKAERREWIKKRHELHEIVDAVLPATKQDIEEEAGLMESFGEFTRDKNSLKKVLTSDEG